MMLFYLATSHLRTHTHLQTPITTDFTLSSNSSFLPPITQQYRPGGHAHITCWNTTSLLLCCNFTLHTYTSLRPKNKHTYTIPYSTLPKQHCTTHRKGMATTNTTAQPGGSSTSVKEWNDRLAAFIKSLEQEQVIRNPGTPPLLRPIRSYTHTHIHTHL